MLSNELSRAMEPVRRLPATLAAALPVTDVTALQQRGGSPAMGPPSGYALPPGPSPQVCSVVSHRPVQQTQPAGFMVESLEPQKQWLRTQSARQLLLRAVKGLLEAEREQLRMLLSEAMDAAGQRIAASQVRARDDVCPLLWH